LRYTVKPGEINAWQFDGDNFGEIQAVVGERPVKDNPEYYIKNFDDVRQYWVDIPDGITAVVWVEPSQQWAGVKPGDYIVQDADGNFYPCEKSIFERKYEPVHAVNIDVNFQDGAVTAEQINRSIGHSIQQSRRFQG
jgi:hypothetical protein